MRVIICVLMLIVSLTSQGAQAMELDNHDKKEMIVELFNAIERKDESKVKNALTWLAIASQGNPINLNGLRDSSGNTPLHNAALSAQPGLIKLLFEYGALWFQVNNQGLKPLDLLKSYLEQHEEGEESLENSDDAEDYNSGALHKSIPWHELIDLLTYGTRSRYYNAPLADMNSMKCALERPGDVSQDEENPEFNQENDDTGFIDNADPEAELYQQKIIIIQKQKELIFFKAMQRVIKRFFESMKSKKNHQSAHTMLLELLKALGVYQFDPGNFMFSHPETFASHSLLYHVLQAGYGQENILVSPTAQRMVWGTSIGAALVTLMSWARVDDIQGTVLFACILAALVYYCVYLTGKYVVPRVLTANNSTADWIGQMIRTIVSTMTETGSAIDDETRDYIQSLFRLKPPPDIIVELFSEYRD